MNKLSFIIPTNINVNVNPNTIKNTIPTNINVNPMIIKNITDYKILAPNVYIFC